MYVNPNEKFKDGKELMDQIASFKPKQKVVPAQKKLTGRLLSKV